MHRAQDYRIKQTAEGERYIEIDLAQKEVDAAFDDSKEIEEEKQRKRELKLHRYQKIARDLELKKEANSQRQKVPRSLSNDDKKHHELVLREAELKIQLEKQRRL